MGIYIMPGRRSRIRRHNIITGRHNNITGRRNRIQGREIRSDTRYRTQSNTTRSHGQRSARRHTTRLASRSRMRRYRRRIGLPLVLILIISLSACTFFRCSISKGGLSDIMTGFKSLSQSEAEEMRINGVPDSLIQLAQKNPETIDFVKNYPKPKTAAKEIDISKDVKQAKGIPHFLQWDERWGYRKYGGDFLAVTGCGPTCLSMVRCGLGKDTKWNPLKIAKKAEKNGYYVAGTGTSWSLMSTGAEMFGLHGKQLSLDEDVIRSTLDNGSPIICAMRPGDFTTSGHFIVLVSVTKKGKIQVNDPNSKKRSSRSWDIDQLIPQIKNLWGYTM